MILNRPLTQEDLASSKKNYICYCTVNGFSYMCLGETVLTLFAVNLGCSDSIVAILGSMIYFGFLLLPLGKWTTARVGAVQSQADFWVKRNIAALLVACAAPVYLYVSKPLATILLVLGAFLFYGFRAAGVIMSQPLIGEICPKEQQGGFISRSWVYFYSSGLVALLLISGIRKISESIWVLFGIIIVGTICGFISSGFFRKMYETGQIKEYAKRPIRDSLGVVCRNPAVRRQVIAGMVCNLGSILTVPISLLTLKRGYGVSDSRALLYSLIQFGASIAGSWVLSRVADRFGGRRMILTGFYGFYLIVLFWICVPNTFLWPLLIIPFLLCPSGPVIATNSLEQYFLATVPKEQQVVASIVTAVGTGVASGLCGMAISSGLLKLAARLNTSDVPLTTYRYYFIAVLILLPILSIFVHRLPKDR